MREAGAVLKGLLIFIGLQLVIGLLRGLVLGDLPGAARSLAGAATGCLVALTTSLVSWALLLHSATCALGWLFEVGPWLLDFNSRWALHMSGSTCLLVATLAPLCWTLGLCLNLQFYILISSEEELMPLFTQHGGDAHEGKPFSTLFSWEVEAKEPNAALLDYWMYFCTSGSR
ncbi:unnamed protein product [Effrenium voratum]|nr:unnamed protein product [Effrenium voratum]